MLFNILTNVAEVIVEVATGLFNTDNNNEETNKSNEELTREYLERLSYAEIEEYFDTNEYLNRYGDNYKYSNKQQFINSICEIARKENRSFTNKYDRY